MLVNVKWENQEEHKEYISGLRTLLDYLTFNSTAKRKLAMLAFLYCRELVKNSLQCTTATCLKCWVSSIYRKNHKDSAKTLNSIDIILPTNFLI